MIWNKNSTSKEIVLGAYLDDTLSDRERRECEKDLGRNYELFELKTAVESVISSPSACIGGNAPEQLINRVVDLHKTRPSFAHVTLGFLDKTIELLACSNHMSVFRPLAASVRGVGAQTSTIILARVFETMQVEVEAERGSADKGCSVRMSVIPSKPCSEGSKYRVTLIYLDRELFSGPLENGQVLFEDMVPGVYSFTIRNSGKIVGEVSLKLVDQMTGGTCGY